MKTKALVLISVAVMLLAGCGNQKKGAKASDAAAVADTAVVYFTRNITPESLVKIYEALGVTPQGKVAVKISTGEMGGNNYLKPELIKGLIDKVSGTIVECNTAYGGSRSETALHLQTIAAHGFDKVAAVDIMDAEGEIRIPVVDTTWIKYDLVGKNVENYDFMINLAHFKGHEMGGFGGVLKNASIGVASKDGKGYIHSAGKVCNAEESWNNLPENWSEKPENNDPFIESMAAAAQAVHNYYKAKNGIVYIDIMNNMSIDCDCSSHPAEPKLKDRGIMASLDPVALDKACLDIVFGINPSEGDDNTDLINRINERHGAHIIEHGEKIGLGTTVYKIVCID